MGIASKLIRLMKEQNTNANELAKKADIPATTIYSLIRRDSSRVDIDSLIKIARALNTTADYLCNDDDEPEFPYSSNEQELIELREQLHKTPGMRTLFSLAKNATPEDLRLVEDMLKRMKKDSGFDGPED